MSKSTTNIERELERKEQESGLFEKNDPHLGSVNEIEKTVNESGLGSVKKDDESIATGWHSINVNELPSAGMFYPEDATVQIRAATVSDIRHFSTLDETDLFDVDDKLNHIIKTSSRLISSNKQMTWKDILEEDRIFVLLAIRDLTFSEPENALQFSKKCDECDEENIIRITKDAFTLNKIPEELQKYYDHKTRNLEVETKSAGHITIKPPSIGIMQVITKYIKDKELKDQSWDKAWIQLAPYVFSDWRGLTAKKIYEGEVDSKGWNSKEFMIRHQLAEKLKVGVMNEMSVICENCGAGVTAPVRFPGGIKSFFIVSDFSGELL